jgi:hypothetical protein
MSEQIETKPTGLELLRQPFPKHQISKLPKPYKKDSPKGNCKDCGGYHGLPAVHLDYVGHAALTDRLLDADPSWTWEPIAFRDGLPAFDETGGLWIKLTVCGVTRLGYGHAEGKPYMDRGAREKEVIGDALRNAAMRFGAALDLWHKGDLHQEEEPPPKSEAQRVVDAKVSPTSGARERLTPERLKVVEKVASEILDCFEVPDGIETAYDVLKEGKFDADEYVALWTYLSSAHRSALKKVEDGRKAKAKETATA